MELTIIHRLELSPAFARILERMAFPGVNVVAAPAEPQPAPVAEPKPPKAPKAPKPAPIEPVAPAEAAAATPPTEAAEPALTIDAVAKIVSRVVKTIGNENVPLVQALFKKYGGKSLPAVKPVDYPDFVKALLALEATVGKKEAS